MIKWLIIKKFNKEKLLNQAKKYYENKRNFKNKQVRNKYRELCKWQKDNQKIEETEIKICLKKINKN